MEHEKKPVIYVFHGDDQLAIGESIAELKSRLGDRSTVELNLTMLDGRSFSIQEFETASKSLPFLSERRLIVIDNPLAYMNSDTNRRSVLALLEEIPEQNAVVLAEYRPLLSPKDKRQGKAHWLEQWVNKNKEKTYIKEFSVAKSDYDNRPAVVQMTDWIVARAHKQGGQINQPAAALLASLVGDDVCLADQEILKLLTYVNYERPIEKGDVEELTPTLAERSIFELVDALGNRDRKTAIGVFHRLLADQDQLRIFSMIVRQFRLLLLSREILDQNGGEIEVTRRLKLHPFVGRKIASQARFFNQSQLESIYHRLLDIDSSLKTGMMSVDLSVDLLIAEIT